MSKRIKEIALIVAGIDEEYQNGVIKGILSCAKEYNANISCFTAFGGVIMSKSFDIGEYNIFRLPNYEFFDGVLLMINTINDPEEKERIVERIRASTLPTVVFDCADYPDFHNVTIDNTLAMEELVRHVIKHHGARTLEYLSGPDSNPESNERFAAFLKVCDENGISVTPDRIHHGELRSIDGKRAAEEMLNSGRPLPDALICANDAMALTAIGEFMKNGILIPEDMIVTGFDNTLNARNYFPALSTVQRPLELAGSTACRTLLDLIEGKNHEMTKKFECSAVFSESCGCKNDMHEDLTVYKKTVFGIIDSSRDDINLINRMNAKLAEAENESVCMSIISSFLGDIGCEYCCICLCDGWAEAHAGNDSLTLGYSKRMHAPLIWDKGTVRYFGSFDTAQMNPIRFDSGGNITYFLPLHFSERCLGYFVMANGDFPTRSMLCHSMTMIISNSLENVRKLITLNSAVNELDRLYTIDPLCGIYNRTGFIRTADEKFQMCKLRGEKAIIAFVDMDGLKNINDKYGHKEGDYGLKKLAEVLSDCCKEGWFCARFGGDEFILFGENASDRDAEELCSNFEKRLEMINNTGNKPYKISASIGTVVSDINEEQSLFGIINQADEIMYEQKKRKPSRYIRK